jgi:hypothetical protein
MGETSIERGVRATRLAAAGAASGSGAFAEAVAQASAGLAGTPSVVFAFPSGSPSGELDAAAASNAAGAPIVGISGNGSIGAAGAIETGCAALALSDSVSVGIGVGRDAGSNLRAATRDAADDALSKVSARNAILLLFLDTRTGDQADAVAGAYGVAGPEIPLAGGAGGGAEPFQLAGEETIEKGVVAVALGSDSEIGLSQVHGCHMIGTPAIVTSSEDRVITELNGRPALDVFLEETGFAGLAMEDGDFEALAVTHPLAQPELNRSERIRHILGREGTGLVCATRVPENAAVMFTRETPEAVVATAGQGVSEALASLGEAPARAALVFDCAGRKRAAADSLSHEVSGILNAFPGDRPPLAGLFTHGEIARIRGAKGDRNHALVVVALA